MLKSYQGQGQPIDQVRQAVMVENGEDCIITDIEEANAHIGPSFPPGTTSYIVHRRSATCTHAPPCVWWDRAYNYKGMTVVLDLIDTLQTSVAAIKKALECER